MTVNHDTNTDEVVHIGGGPIGGFYFFCVGMGIQVCWSSVLNSLDYFKTYYPDNNVDFTFPVAVYLAQFIVTVLMTKISAYYRFSTRIVVPFIVASIILAFLPFQAPYFQKTTEGYYMIMSMLFVMGFCSNTIYSSMIGISSKLPGQYTTYFLIGSGASSMTLSVLRLLMKSIFPDRVNLSVTVFFITSALFIITAVALHMKFIRSEFYRKNLLEEETNIGRSLTDEEISLTRTPSKNKRDPETVREVFKKIYIYPFAIGLTFVQMFAVFPGVMLKKDMGTMPMDIKLTTLNFTFSIFFIVGKKLGQYRKYYNKQFVFGVVLFRFVLDAFMILQAVSNTMPIISSIWFAYVNILMFGLTTGFANCALFILGPESLPKEKKEVAGFVSVFGLATGTLIGVLAALPMKYL